jgi:uncharacterized protein (DUF433 family)
MKICHISVSGKYRIEPVRPHTHAEVKQDSSLKHWRRYVLKHRRNADHFNISMREAFAFAEKQVSSIVVRRDLMGGNPCIEGTRIPVYMILDGIEYYGSLKGVLKSYPQLSLKQIKDAVRFSKIVIECSA